MAKITRWAELEKYTPEGHKNTTNRKLVTETQSSGSSSVVYGILSKDGAADYHFHERSQQITHILQGQCIVKYDGETTVLSAGDSIVFDVNESHSVLPNNQNELRLVNIYIPPLENDDIHVVNPAPESK